MLQKTTLSLEIRRDRRRPLNTSTTTPVRRSIWLTVPPVVTSRAGSLRLAELSLPDAPGDALARGGRTVETRRCRRRVGHLRHPHHTPEFWQALEPAMPDFVRRRAWLAEHGAEFWSSIAYKRPKRASSSSRSAYAREAATCAGVRPDLLAP